MTHDMVLPAQSNAFTFLSNATAGFAIGAFTNSMFVGWGFFVLTHWGVLWPLVHFADTGAELERFQMFLPFIYMLFLIAGSATTLVMEKRHALVDFRDMRSNTRFFVFNLLFVIFAQTTLVLHDFYLEIVPLNSILATFAALFLYGLGAQLAKVLGVSRSYFGPPSVTPRLLQRESVRIYNATIRATAIVHCFTIAFWMAVTLFTEPGNVLEFNEPEAKFWALIAALVILTPFALMYTWRKRTEEVVKR